MHRTHARARLALMAFLAAASLAACSDSGGGDASPAADTTSSASPNAPVGTPGAAGDLTLHPVLEVVSCPSADDGGGHEGGDTGGSDASSEESSDSSAALVPGLSGLICYRLGPAAADASDFDESPPVGQAIDAEVGLVVTVDPAARDKVNQLFNGCYRGVDGCPGMSLDNHGSIAVVFNGAVVSAPTVLAEDLAEDPFQITADGDQETLAAIAATIDAA